MVVAPGDTDGDADEEVYPDGLEVQLYDLPGVDDEPNTTDCPKHIVRLPPV